MPDQIKLQEPITNGSLRATNFFNGRLVTGNDLSREQDSRREAVRRIGKAAGTGIVYGLEVEKDYLAGNDPVVNVSAGLAINGCGQALFVSQDTNVNLLERFGSAIQSSSIFGDCQPLQVGTYTAGYGLYLLVLTPAQKTEGTAPTSGLNNAFSTCNTDVILETAQFRLLAIDPFLSGETLPNQQKLRNYLAYRCFGVEETQKFFADPLGFSVKIYGLIDEMRENVLSNSDVPLAIINWTATGIKFVEMWAVRRRLIKRNDDEDWKQLFGDRRKAETEAMMRQFTEQIGQIERETANLSALDAEDFFRFLPPAGIIPLASSGKKGFDYTNFFGNHGSTEIPNTDGDRLRVLLDQAVSHEPIDLETTEKVQLYYVRENIKAFENGENVRKVLVFARHSLPYIGVARFDEAEWNGDRFSSPVK